jgi:hypothetical protein
MFLRTNINVAVLKDVLFKTQALAQTKQTEKGNSQIGDDMSEKSSKNYSSANKYRN